MSTRTERSQDKSLNEKHALILKSLMQRADNKKCVDCRKKDPRWASWNLGVFMCIRCSGIHRSMGTHISKVKSADLDTWTPEQIENMVKWGNGKANIYWEHELPKNMDVPENNIEQFIRAKYERKQYVMKGPIPDPATLPLPDGVTAVATVQSTSLKPMVTSRPTTAATLIPSSQPAPSLIPSSQSTPSFKADDVFDDFQSAPASTVAAPKTDFKNNILSLYQTSSPAIQPMVQPAFAAFSNPPTQPSSSSLVGQPQGAQFFGQPLAAPTSFAAFSSTPSNTGNLLGGMSSGNTGNLLGNMSSGNTGNLLGNMPSANTGNLLGSMPSGNTGNLLGNMPSANTGNLLGNMPNGNTANALGNFSTTSSTGNLLGSSHVAPANQFAAFSSIPPMQTGNAFAPLQPTSTSLGSFTTTQPTKPAPSTNGSIGGIPDFAGFSSPVTAKPSLPPTNPPVPAGDIWGDFQ